MKSCLACGLVLGAVGWLAVATRIAWGQEAPAVEQAPAASPEVASSAAAVPAGQPMPGGQPVRPARPGPSQPPGPSDEKGKKGEAPAAEAAKTVARPDKPPLPPDPRELKVTPDPHGKIRFNFHGQPWADVLEWLARVSAMSLDWQELPADCLNLVTQREYTVPEARDLINRHLLARADSLP